MPTGTMFLRRIQLRKRSQTIGNGYNYPKVCLDGIVAVFFVFPCWIPAFRHFVKTVCKKDLYRELLNGQMHKEGCC